jgi:hypothetical protein
MHVKAVLRQSQEGVCSFSNEIAESVNRRGLKRTGLTLSALTSSPSAGDLPVVIRDISPGGLLIESRAAELAVEDLIDAELPGSGPVRAKVVWRSGPFFGCQFSQPLAAAVVSAALLKGEPQAAPDTTNAPDEAHALRARLGIEPELNFSVAFLLAGALWGLIGFGIYLAVS